jgi:hypothetical protein
LSLLNTLRCLVLSIEAPWQSEHKQTRKALKPDIHPRTLRKGGIDLGQTLLVVLDLLCFEMIDVELVYGGYEKAHRIEAQLIFMEDNVSKTLKGTGL